jgi:dihydroorotase
VRFDVGHVMAFIDFTAAETALAEGFLSDTISTDQYARHVGLLPPHDLLRTLSKLLAAGLPEPAALAAVTSTTAEVLGLAGEIGTLAPAPADLAVVRFNPAAGMLRDTNGVERRGGCWEPVLTVRAGVPVRRGEQSNGAGGGGQSLSKGG